MSKPLRDAIKGAVIRGAAVGTLVLEWLQYDAGCGETGLFLWCRQIVVDLDGRDITMGHTGQLTRDLNRDAHDLLISE
jgi:hypothetical protein